MLAHDSIAVSITADLSIRVPRSAPGDIVDGTRSVIEAVDGVTRVAAVDVTSMTPNLNDLFVEVTVDAAIVVDGPVDDEADAARSVLLAGFGIDAVNQIAIDRSSPALDND